MDRLVVHPHVRMPPPVLGQDRRHLREAESLRMGFRVVRRSDGDKPVPAK